ncbi:MAG: tyrosine-type recombinase/integrase [Clostridia bacterium]|nr:tyrosine-type recombinase/integrase [Clostridia bacterium]
MKKITSFNIESFKQRLIEEEKSSATIEKYMRDINTFHNWARDKKLDKSCVLDYKGYLMKKYTATSVNSMLSSLNSFFNYLEWFDLRVKTLKIQKQLFASKERELTKVEYEELLSIAERKKDQRLYLLIQAMCSTGIRVSELRFITVEAIEHQRAEISCKGKHRYAFLPIQLCERLKEYAQKRQIKKGPIFVSKNGNPLDRSNIWSEIKELSRKTGVSEKKAFPHNLRHLFARTYYAKEKDVVRLADILGHSSVNTTRIYTMETGEIHQMQIQQLGLVRC